MITCHIAGGVADLRFNRPDKLNALSPAAFARLGELLRAVTDDPAVAVVILRGEGRAFAAGADIDTYVDLSQERFSRFIDDTRAVTDLFGACPKPIVAAVRGFALGGGFELVLACDLEPPKERVLREGHVLLDGGTDFGPAAGSYLRLNFATSRDILDDILDGLERALAADAARPA